MGSHNEIVWKCFLSYTIVYIYLIAFFWKQSARTVQGLMDINHGWHRVGALQTPKSARDKYPLVYKNKNPACRQLCFNGLRVDIHVTNDSDTCDTTEPYLQQHQIYSRRPFRESCIPPRLISPQVLHWPL